MMMSMIRPRPVFYAKWWQMCFHSLIGNRLQYIHQEELFFAEFQNLQVEYVILNEVFLIIDPCFSSLPYDDDVDHHSSNIIIFNELSGYCGDDDVEDDCAPKPKCHFILFQADEE